MSMNAWPQHCPKCGSEDIRSMGRIECDPRIGMTADIEVYWCDNQDPCCGEEFDSDDPRIPRAAVLKPLPVGLHSAADI